METKKKLDKYVKVCVQKWCNSNMRDKFPQEYIHCPFCTQRLREQKIIFSEEKK